jgi:hypothetical protein
MSDEVPAAPSSIHRPLYAYTGDIGWVARHTTYNWLAARPPIRHLDKWIPTFCEARTERILALLAAGLPRTSSSVFHRRLDCSPAGVHLAEPPRRCRWNLCAHCHAASAIKLWTELDAYLFPGGVQHNPNFRMVIARSKFPVREPQELIEGVRDHLGHGGRGRSMARLAPAAAIDVVSAQSDRGRVWAEARRLMLFAHAAPAYRPAMYREKQKVIEELTRDAFREAFVKVCCFSTLMMRGRPRMAVAFAEVASTSKLLQRYGAFRSIPNSSRGVELAHGGVIPEASSTLVATAVR